MRIPKILFIGWLMTVLLTACKDDEKEYVDRFYHYTFENEDITVAGKEQTVNLTITAENKSDSWKSAWWVCKFEITDGSGNTVEVKKPAKDMTGEWYTMSSNDNNIKIELKPNDTGHTRSLKITIGEYGYEEDTIVVTQTSQQ
ncbi:MAG: hypothetical protein K1V91_05730 [Muribaculum sp.]